MGCEAGEECGVCAVSIKDRSKPPHAAHYLYNLLLQLQNRGQLSAGITTYNAHRRRILETHRELGLVKEAFKSSNPPKFDHLMNRLSGHSGIGHVRYATFGSDNLLYAQPFERFHGRTWKWFSFAFNGNLANYWELRHDLEQKKYHFQLESDTEVMMHYLAFQSRGDEKKPTPEIFSGISEQFDGAYAIAYQNADGETVLCRDPYGIKPLAIGETDSLFAGASETVALESLGLEHLRPLEPGQLAISYPNGETKIESYCKPKEKKVCMFEFVYFARPMSDIDNQNVYEARYNMGIELAKTESLPIDSETIVVPVPDTAKPVADAYGYQLGIPVIAGLVKNEYIGRTFIESTNRAAKVMAKFHLNKKLVAGKKVILIEDSIVRGTTTKSVVWLLRTKGKCREIHVRSASPPILYPCFYGIDFSTMNELIANRHQQNHDEYQLSPHEIEKIADEIGCDSLRYQTVEGLAAAIGFERREKDLCLACLNGSYPTPKGQALLQIAKKQIKGEKIRTYEQTQ